MGRLTRLRKENNDLFYKFIGTQKLKLNQAENQRLTAAIETQTRLTRPVVSSLYREYKRAERKYLSTRNIFKKIFFYLQVFCIKSNYSEFNLQLVRFFGVLVVLKEKI